MKRNTLVLSIVLFILAAFAWAGWANFEYRKQAAERLLATAAKGELVVDAAGTPEYVSPLTGKPAPAFALENLNGDKVSLDSFKGKAVLVNFWATWCAPCKIETPWLVELRSQYAAQGFEILGVSFDDLDKDDPKLLAKDKAEIVKTVAALHIPYPVLIDGDTISKPYGDTEVYPTSFFIDRNGKIVGASFGLTSKAELESNIRKALGTSPATGAGE